MRSNDNRKVSRVLIGAGILAYAILAYLFIIEVPAFAVLLANYSLPAAYSMSAPGKLTDIVLCLMEAAGILLAVAIGFYIAICGRIGKGRSFCRENARDLDRIAVLLLCAGALFVSVGIFSGKGELPLLIAVVGIMIAGVSVLAWGLGRLVRHAAVLKEENDLTI